MSQRRPKDRSHWGDAAFSAARAARNPPSDEPGYLAGCGRCKALREFLLCDQATFASDLEHSDPVVRALARGRVSAAEQALRILDEARP